MTGFLILAFLILVAMVVSVPLATRFGLGSVLGYLLAGMAIAPLLAALNVDVVALQVFAEFGVVMMLFIIGLEMEPRRLWDMRGKLLGLGGGQVVLTTAVITGIALLDARPWQTAVAIGMILALSSTAIIVQSLTEKKLMRTEGGEASFSVLLVQDVAVIPILALLPLLAMPDLYASSGGPVGAGAHHGIDLTASMPMWLAAIARIGAVAAVVVIGIYAIRPLFRFIAAARLRELFTGAALLVVIGIALLMSLVGLSPALGAFVADIGTNWKAISIRSRACCWASSSSPSALASISTLLRRYGRKSCSGRQSSSLRSSSFWLLSGGFTACANRRSGSSASAFHRPANSPSC